MDLDFARRLGRSTTPLSLSVSLCSSLYSKGFVDTVARKSTLELVGRRKRSPTIQI